MSVCFFYIILIFKKWIRNYFEGFLFLLPYLLLSILNVAMIALTVERHLSQQSVQFVKVIHKLIIRATVMITLFLNVCHMALLINVYIVKQLILSSITLVKNLIQDVLSKESTVSVSPVTLVWLSKIQFVLVS
jgi:hypothetical protein